MPDPVEPSEASDHDERARGAKAPPPMSLLLLLLLLLLLFVVAVLALFFPASGAAAPLLLFPLPPPLLLVERVSIDDLSSLEVVAEDEPEVVISRTDEAAESIDAESLPESPPLFRCSSSSSSMIGFVAAAAAASLDLLVLDACCCCCCAALAAAALAAAIAASARSLAWPAALARHCAQPSCDLQTGWNRTGL